VNGIIISQEAASDLENIWLYTLEKWSQQQADKYHRQLIEAIKQLALNPYLGKDVGYILKGYYRLKAQSHLIFYKIDDIGNNIMIIRILHEQMDVQARLKA
jgi:toxin ParE1/3/4